MHHPRPLQLLAFDIVDMPLDGLALDVEVRSIAVECGYLVAFAWGLVEDRRVAGRRFVAGLEAFEDRPRDVRRETEPRRNNLYSAIISISTTSRQEP